MQFAKSADGTHVAWARIGSGRPIFKAPNWLNHLDYEWRSPLWTPFYTAVAKKRELVRFDQRGNGLSEWEPGEISETRMVEDMHAVIQSAGLERFSMFVISQGCSFSIRYATRYPEKVSCLVFVGGYLRGRLRRDSEDQKKLHEALGMLIDQGWGSPNPVFRHTFSSSFMPDAPVELANGFDELQRVSTSPESAKRIWHMNNDVDVTEMARNLEIPTLVLHCEDDRVAPLEEGQLIAKTMPNSRFVQLPGNNHVLVPNTPAFDLFLTEMDRFLSEHGA